ncbi:hypothetical protein PsYK624_097430 [Phanerochaete sordida]|uniref:Uncharacterized protein n=1 Tax=Phanerochaete sordida TaxID=48140 RepID=A0A9P3LGB6_9APHY|nr:hypothetical protein PsYK624_097430 [Phanerochaete sordida]
MSRRAPWDSGRLDAHQVPYTAPRLDAALSAARHILVRRFGNSSAAFEPAAALLVQSFAPSVVLQLDITCGAATPESAVEEISSAAVVSLGYYENLERIADAVLVAHAPYA